VISISTDLALRSTDQLYVRMIQRCTSTMRLESARRQLNKVRSDYERLVRVK